MKIAAAKAFYEYCHDDAVQKDLFAHRGAHFVSILANVADQTRKLSADVHVKTMLNAKTEYRWNFFDFMVGYLIRIHQDKKCYESNLKYWPGMQKLEALPTLGWKAYQRLLTESYGHQQYLAAGQLAMGASCQLVFDAEGPKEVVFSQRLDWQLGWYMERIPLERIGTTPTTFGEEIEALAAWLQQAGEALQVCNSRGYGSFFTGPKALTTKQEPQRVYKKAKVRPASHDDAATGEAIRLAELMSRVSHFAGRLTASEKELFRKYPEKVSSCLSPAM